MLTWETIRRFSTRLRNARQERNRLERLDSQNLERTRTLLADRTYVYEKELFLLPRLVVPGTTVFDIGANDGVYTSHLSRLVGAEGLVIAVEPGRRAFCALRSLVKREQLRNVALHRNAAGAACGKLTLYVPDYTKIAQIECADHVSGPAETVPMTTVDNLVRRHKVAALSLMKVDVEGAELLVLEGAKDTLLRFRPGLILELADVHLTKFKTTGQEILERLWQLGYESFEFGWETKELKPVRQITLKGGHTWSRLDEDLSTNNYVFVHKTKLLEPSAEGAGPVRDSGVVL
jgi:FkbM family methyltransferase